MKYEEFSWYSPHLEREMKIRIYGHYGPAFVAFPCQGGLSDDFYINGMIDRLSDYIESGRMKLFCVDANDDETVSSENPDKGYRSYKLEMFHQYFVEEAVPFIKDQQGGYEEIYLIGLSMGASHAVNQFLRRPELYSGCIGISGRYDMTQFFDYWIDENLYNNSPVHYLAGMPKDHYYIDIYNSKKVFIEVGCGAYEYLVRDSNVRLAEICEEKGIHFDFEFWDENTIHDWVSWFYSLPYFLDKII